MPLDRKTDKRETALSQAQLAAWEFYGWPGGLTSSGASPAPTREPVGEVRYVVGWMSDQISRMGWKVLIDGSETWSVSLPDGRRITSDGGLDRENPTSLATASADLLEEVAGWKPTKARQVATNLFVAGEGDYLPIVDQEERTRWVVVSVVDPDRDELLAKAAHRIKFIWPHPADPHQPDAPLFGVLPILQDLEWLNRVARAQMSNRAALRGILAAVDGLTFQNGNDFWTEWQATLRAKMANPEDASPVLLRGSQDMVKDGLNWLIPDFPYDDGIGEKQRHLIERLAYGLPVPPEILLGMQAQSRATAFQVDENAYRAHIEPAAGLVAPIPEAALRFALPDVDIEVVPDPSAILARRHSVQDVKDAYDRGEVSGSYLREVLGIPENAMPEVGDGDPAVETALSMVAKAPSLAQDPGIPMLVAQIRSVLGDASAPVEGDAEVPAAEQDPGEEAAQEGQPMGLLPITAAVVGESPLSEKELESLSDALTALDYQLRTELSGASAIASERARHRVGAKTRTHKSLREQIPSRVKNADVAGYLGVQALRDAGIPLEQIVADAVKPLVDFWQEELVRAGDTLADLIGGADGQRVRDSLLVVESAERLAELAAAFIIETLESPLNLPLPMDQIQQVADIAGGATVGY